MTLHQIAENWNGQVAKLCNWAINSLDSASDKDDEETTRTDCHPASVKPHDCTGIAVTQGGCSQCRPE